MSNSTTCCFPASVYFPCDGIVKPLKYNSSHDGIVIVALSPVAVVGNSLVLSVIWKKTFERTSFHVLLSALTDLFTGLVSQPFLCLPYFLLLVKPSVFMGRTSLLLTSLTIGISTGVFFGGSTIFILTMMSVERWLHMTRRSLMTPRRRCFTITVLLPTQPNSHCCLGRRGHREGKGRRRSVRITFAIFTLLCYLITSFSYFKVFQVIRQHQHQVQGNQSCENVAHPAINLAKYKKTVMAIFYILALFSIFTLPMVVSLAVLVYKGITFETSEVYYVCLVLFFSSSSLNPILYLWRMNDIRSGVKRSFCASG